LERDLAAAQARIAVLTEALNQIAKADQLLLHASALALKEIARQALTAPDSGVKGKP
jgi:hypothetical protein